jgi:thymidylate synthase ThyX
VLDQVIDTLISVHFGRFKVLEGYVGNLIRTQVDTCKALAKEAVKKALDLEATPYYTQNTHYLQTLSEKWLAYYKIVRKRKLDRAPTVYEPVAISPYHRGESPESKALRALAEAGYTSLSIPDLARLLPPDSREKELIVMADVRAYYHVAYKRIIDHIPLTIEHALHHALAEQLSQSLLTSLLTDVASGPNFSERMNELVSEDASIAQRRAALSTRKQRLSDIRRRLVTFGSSA